MYIEQMLCTGPQCGWVLASWNVRTLLNVEGPIEVARQNSEMHTEADERKIDQVVDDLHKYGVDVAGLQDTKCCGDGVYKRLHEQHCVSLRMTSTRNCREGKRLLLFCLTHAVGAW